MPSRKVAILVLAIVILAVLIYFFKGLFVAAIVNGQPISRFTVTSELQKQGGKQVLDSLVTKALISQEAKKEKVTVSDAEVSQAVKDLEANLTKQGQNLDELLKAQSLTRPELMDQIRMQKIVEKILGKDIKVTDQEASDYYDKNKTSYPNAKTFEEAKTEVIKQLESQKLNEKVTPWIQTLHDKAKINYFVKF